MDIKFQKKPNSLVEFQIKATKEEIAIFFDQALVKLSKEINLPGFRPGKVPSDVAKEAIGEEVLNSEAQDLAINDGYLRLITENNLVPIERPRNVKVNSFGAGRGLEWEGEVDVIPEIDTSNWRDVLSKQKGKINKEEVAIEDSEIEKTLESLQKQFSDLEEKEGKSEKGDWLNIDIDIADKEGFTPEQIAKFQSKGFSLVIGEAGFIPGFEDELIGLEKGSEKEFASTFPENYFEKSLVNKKVKFKVKVNDIRRVVLPEINEDFSKKFGFENKEALKEAIKKDMEAKKENMAKIKFEDSVLDAIIKSVKIDIPKSLVEQEKDSILSRFVHDLEHHKGIRFSDYLASLGKNEKEFRDGFEENAINNVKMGLVLGQITKDEKVEVADNDIQEVMSMDVLNQTMGLPAEKASEMKDKIEERYKDEEFLQSVRNSILARKTIDLMVGVLGESK